MEERRYSRSHHVDGGTYTITATDGGLRGTAGITVFKFVAKSVSSSTNATTQSVTGIGSAVNDTLLVLINYYSNSTALPTCNPPSGTALKAVALLASSSQWSGNGSPYYGYCAYTADVNATNSTATESLSVRTEPRRRIWKCTSSR